MATLLDAKMGEGTHSLVFDAKELPSGVYLLQLITGGEQKKPKDAHSQIKNRIKRTLANFKNGPLNLFWALYKGKEMLKTSSA